jgi:hypothetical protein
MQTMARSLRHLASLLLVASAVACEGAHAQVATVSLPAQPPPPLPPPGASAPPPAAPVATPLLPVDGPPAPAKRPIDPAFKVDGAGLLLGVTSTELWLLLGDHYTVVVDRASGCAVEGYTDPPVLTALRKLKDTQAVEAELARPEVLAAIRDVVGLGRRLGAQRQHFLLEMVWSLDGRYIFLEANDILYRSADGGRSFARVDDFFSSRLAMSNDGRHLVYERCIESDCPSCGRAYGPGCNSGRQYVSLPTDGSRGPRAFTSSQTHLLDMPPSGRAIFTRSDVEVCADTFELGRPARESSVCVPFSKKATGSWPMREWYSVSPSGRYGIVKWEEGRPNLAGAIALTYVVSLVDMASRQLVKTITDVRGDVDDDGNMVLQSMSEGGGDHTYYYPLKGPRRLLGHHHLVAWSDKTAILGVHRVAPLGARKCDLVKSVKTSD